MARVHAAGCPRRFGCSASHRWRLQVAQYHQEPPLRHIGLDLGAQSGLIVSAQGCIAETWI